METAYLGKGLASSGDENVSLIHSLELVLTDIIFHCDGLALASCESAIDGIC